MSEIPYFGRTSVYIGTLFAFVLLQLGVIYAKNFGMLLAFRFLTGFVGSPVLATGGATIADMYAPKKQIYGIAVWGVAAVIGPVSHLSCPTSNVGALDFCRVGVDGSQKHGTKSTTNPGH